MIVGLLCMEIEVLTPEVINSGKQPAVYLTALCIYSRRFLFLSSNSGDANPEFPGPIRKDRLQLTAIDELLLGIETLRRLSNAKEFQGIYANPSTASSNSAHDQIFSLIRSFSTE